MKEMVDKYKTVLVVGGEGEKCREVAEGYGFKDVITPGDIIRDNKHTTPFRRLTDQETNASRPRNFRKTRIEAVFVFADSRDWAGDCQIILDIAMSINGYIGTLSDTFDEGPPIYFSHNDVVWSAAHKNVRLGMGALRKVIETLFSELTGGKQLETIAFGKPQIGTFEFATRLLQQWRKDEHGVSAPPDTVYFVGDTPESDIRGTNLYNEKASNDWHSILVKTGVWKEGTEPAYKPKATVDTVLDAIKYGMKREFTRKMNEATKKMALNGSAIDSTIEEVSNESTPVITPITQD
jgi:HAD superfamily hydrolase (TIGR01456 family)